MERKENYRTIILLQKFGKLALSINVFLIPFNSQAPWTAKRGTCDKKNISGRGLHESCHSKILCRRKKNKVAPEPRENSLKIVNWIKTTHKKIEQSHSYPNLQTLGSHLKEGTNALQTDMKCNMRSVKHHMYTCNVYTYCSNNQTIMKCQWHLHIASGLIQWMEEIVSADLRCCHSDPCLAATSKAEQTRNTQSLIKSYRQNWEKFGEILILLKTRKFRFRDFSTQKSEEARRWRDCGQRA